MRDASPRVAAAQRSKQVRLRGHARRIWRCAAGTPTNSRIELQRALRAGLASRERAYQRLRLTLERFDLRRRLAGVQGEAHCR